MKYIVYEIHCTDMIKYIAHKIHCTDRIKSRVKYTQQERDRDSTHCGTKYRTKYKLQDEILRTKYDENTKYRVPG